AGRLAKRTTINEETNTFYYHTDHLGSTRLVTDQSKNIVADAKYEPFGEATVTGEESYLYNGKERDSTGLYYYGARYYDPETGRFITRDPLVGKRAIPQSLNRYTYCLSNPVKLVDPAGLTYRMCDANSGKCLRFYEWVKPGRGVTWTAYDANGNKITDSLEIESLLDPTGKSEKQIKADQAKAAYLMLLVTHPEIEGDPNQDPSNVCDEGGIRVYFEYEVTIDGKSINIMIGIDDRAHGYDKFGNTIYAYTRKVSEREFEIVFYQQALSSVEALFHMAGHEGQHVVDYVTTGSTTEESAWAWNARNDLAPPYYVPFPFPRSQFPLLPFPRPK
ncbi:MAG: hypothetical protein HXS46_00030, partial [Theionarchaea archaeon]|nr:hypothetical protein [Theionarchaea archaeon]